MEEKIQEIHELLNSINSRLLVLEEKINRIENAINCGEKTITFSYGTGNFFGNPTCTTKLTEQ